MHNGAEWIQKGALHVRILTWRRRRVEEERSSLLLSSSLPSTKSPRPPDKEASRSSSFENLDLEVPTPTADAERRWSAAVASLREITEPWRRIAARNAVGPSRSFERTCGQEALLRAYMAGVSVFETWGSLTSSRGRLRPRTGCVTRREKGGADISNSAFAASAALLANKSAEPSEAALKPVQTSGHDELASNLAPFSS